MTYNIHNNYVAEEMSRDAAFVCAHLASKVRWHVIVCCDLLKVFRAKHERTTVYAYPFKINCELGLIQ